MKILFLIDNLGAGGKERRFTELVKGLQKNHTIKFEIVVMNSNIHYKEILNLDTKIHYLIRKTKKDLRVFSGFYSICKIYKPDLVHCWDDMTAVISVPTCKLLNIKLVNGMVIDTPVKRNLTNKSWVGAKLTFPFSTKIVGNSKAGLSAYGAPPKKSVCIYNGIDFNRFNNLRDPQLLKNEILGKNSENYFTVGMVAGFYPRKDYKTLIEGAMILIETNSDIRFILVGDGPDINDMKAKVPFDLKDKIIFLGKRSDIESLVSCFDVGVLLTNAKIHGEGISNSILEYLASGKPVVATYGGGTNEIIIDQKNGFLIEPGNHIQFTDSIIKLKNNKSLQIQFGNEGKKMTYNTFNLDTMTNNYIKLYKSILKTFK